LLTQASSIHEFCVQFIGLRKIVCGDDMILRIDLNNIIERPKLFENSGIELKEFSGGAR
jgi:hypothetical protein